MAEGENCANEMYQRYGRGLEVVFKTATDGGVNAWNELLVAVKNRLESGQHGLNVLPIVSLEKDSYQSVEHGRVLAPAAATC